MSYPHIHQPLRSLSNKSLSKSSHHKHKSKKKERKKKKKDKIRSFPSRSAIKSPPIPEEEEHDHYIDDDVRHCVLYALRHYGSSFSSLFPFFVCLFVCVVYHLILYAKRVFSMYWIPSDSLFLYLIVIIQHSFLFNLYNISVGYKVLKLKSYWGDQIFI